MSRRLNRLDHLLVRVQQTLDGNAPASGRPAPAPTQPPGPLTAPQRHHVAGLMRVNHAGEVAAQALYHGQSLVTRDPAVREQLLHAAAEERDHLDWCTERLQQLGESPSRLQPLWYAASFTLGAAAGMAGDRWSLGFVEETERQVVDHLEGHLESLPPEDTASRAILETMRADEARHGAEARAAGGASLPVPVQLAMRLVARVMTRTAYWF
jgi:ubiquinone biosynthesis monooxygenase Coq7